MPKRKKTTGPFSRAEKWPPHLSNKIEAITISYVHDQWWYYGERKGYDADELAPLRVEAILRNRRIQDGLPANYLEFLETPYWLELAARLKAQRDWTCERCKRRRPPELNVHHKTYKHLGHEDPDHLDDLEVLCRECHRKEHGIA
jgi:5-methylcytosine-specific restriction endonuclease McrA